MTKRRPERSFEDWSTGRDGSILFCEQGFRLAVAHVRRTGRQRGVHVYKTEQWAAAHQDRYGHRMLPVQDAEPLLRRLWPVW